jgi:hypothetical protein
MLPIEIIYEIFSYIIPPTKMCTRGMDGYALLSSMPEGRTYLDDLVIMDWVYVYGNIWAWSAVNEEYSNFVNMATIVDVFDTYNRYMMTANSVKDVEYIRPYLDGYHIIPTFPDTIVFDERVMCFTDTRGMIIEVMPHGHTYSRPFAGHEPMVISRRLGGFMKKR